MRDVVMGLQPITILKTEEELNQENVTKNYKKETSFNNRSKAKIHESKNLISILKNNKERVEKCNNDNVTFNDDCIFNKKNYCKYKKEEYERLTRPTYLQVASKCKNSLQKNDRVILSK